MRVSEESEKVLRHRQFKANVRLAMGRKKLKLQWIVDDTARKVTYQRRMKNLIKKVKEISVLCGVDACAIVNSPYDPRPELWPSPSQAVRVLRDFERRPENDHAKKRLNQENFLRQRFGKLNAQLVKQQKKNWRMETENFINRCLAGDKGLQGLTMEKAHDLVWTVDNKLRAISEKIDSFHQHPQPPPPSAADGGDAPAPPPVVSVPQNMSLDAAIASLEGQILVNMMAPQRPRGAPAPPAAVSVPQNMSPEEAIASLEGQILMNMMAPQQPRGALAPPAAVSVPQNMSLEAVIASPERQILMNMMNPQQPRDGAGASTSPQPGGLDYGLEELNSWGSTFFP